MREDYIYAVARIRARELTLLNRQDVDQLMACRSYEECLRTLQDKGWGNGTVTDAESVLAAEEEKIWGFIKELTDDPILFKVLLCPTDYNNLKAAIKCVVTGTEPHEVFLPGGTLEPEKLMQCVRESDFSSLPESMAAPADAAYKALLQGQDGQRCDVILDRACLTDILAAAKESRNETLTAYAELLAATGNIKVAARACKTEKSKAFLEEALVPCETLDVALLADAACGSMESLFDYLSHTSYWEGGEALKASNSAFEKWCDDRIMALIKDQKTNPFTLGPLLAFVLARRCEISVVRIILSGKLNALPDAMIRERLRDLYV